MIEHKELIANAFKGLATILMGICLFILKDFGSSLDNMQHSVNKLNVSFAGMSERLISQTFKYDLLEQRIRIIETRYDERTKDRWTKADHLRYREETRREIRQIYEMIKLNGERNGK